MILPAGFRENTGRMPRRAAGKRVKVVLANGRIAEGDWAADGRAGCRWTITGHPFDIAGWKLVE